MAKAEATTSEFLTTSQVASLLHVSASTVRRYDRKGLLRSVQTAGGHRRYTPESVTRLAGNNAETEPGGDLRDAAFQPVPAPRERRTVTCTVRHASTAPTSVLGRDEVETFASDLEVA